LVATDTIFPLSDKEKAMKIYVVAAFSVFLSLSCGKTNITGDAIAGKWELRELSGGIAGTIKYSPGNGNIVQFDRNNRYTYSFSGTTIQTGSYTIKKIVNTGDWRLQLQYFSNGQSFTNEDSIRFQRNQLVFLPRNTCCDIPTAYYDRLP
jgi:hypothetical protein